jgi:hypothetical protein
MLAHWMKASHAHPASLTSLSYPALSSAATTVAAPSAVTTTVTKEAKYKCDIYMVFDYAEHDLTGLMDATRNSALRPDQVRGVWV